MTDPTPFEHSARIVEAMSAGASEDASLALGQVAAAIRESAAVSVPDQSQWDVAAGIAERYAAASGPEVAEILTEAAGAMREQAFDV